MATPAITGRLRVGLVLTLSVLASASGSTFAIANAAAATHHKHHSTKHHRVTHHSTKNGIPQGNVGDNDPDNHGAPSDGDGNI
jgi:hypothetical protein